MHGDLLDFYGSTDLLIPDFRDAVDTAVGALGFELPSSRHGNWEALDRPDHPARLGFTYVFLRTDRSLPAAPTRFEIMAPHPVGAGMDPPYRAEQVMAAQGTRPIKTHALTIATSRIEELIERAGTRGWRHRIDAATPEIPAPRLWLGFSDDEPSVYRPDVDGGLMIELFPTAFTGHSPAEVLGGVEPAPVVPEGGLVRIVARAVLVDRLETTVSRLADALDWEPDGPIDRVADEGCRRAVLSFAAPHSARLELLEADGDGQAAAFAAEHGAGPWQITISVNGLEAKAELLRERGVAHVLLVPGPGRPVPTLRARPGHGLHGAVVDFVDHTTWAG